MDVLHKILEIKRSISMMLDTPVFIQMAVLAAGYHITSLFIGQRRARVAFRNLFLNLATLYQRTRIPTLKEGEPFSKFMQDYERVFPVSRLNRAVVRERGDGVYCFEIRNCPRARYARAFKMLEIAKGGCQSDLTFIREYQPRIKLEREHTCLDRGQDYCDFRFSLSIVPS